MNLAAKMIPTRYIFWGVNSLLAAAIAYSAAAMSMRILEGVLISGTPAPVRSAGRNPQQKSHPRLPLSRFQTVLDANVFHAKRTANTTITAPTTATARKTPVKTEVPGKLPIRLSLSGTIVMGSASSAFVVGPNGRDEGVYQLGQCMPHVGDQVSQECTPAQAKLLEVRLDSISVGMNGNKYEIRLNDQEPALLSAAPPGRKSNPRRTSRRSAGPAKPAFSTNRKGNVIETRIPNAEVEKAFENFAGIMNQARVVPYMVDGAVQGFQIRKIVPGSIYQRLGLRNSDIIKSVNGQSLTTADQALRLFTVFKNEQEITLEIQRGSKPFILNYIIE